MYKIKIIPLRHKPEIFPVLLAHSPPKKATKKIIITANNVRFNLVINFFYNCDNSGITVSLMAKLCSVFEGEGQIMILSLKSSYVMFSVVVSILSCRHFRASKPDCKLINAVKMGADDEKIVKKRIKIKKKFKISSNKISLLKSKP